MSWSRAQNDPSPMAEGTPRPVLRLSRPSSARRPTETDAVAPPMNLDHAAVDIMGAVKGAASSLGAGPVEPGGLTAAQVLENPAEAARAALEDHRPSQEDDSSPGTDLSSSAGAKCLPNARPKHSARTSSFTSPSSSSP